MGNKHSHRRGNSFIGGENVHGGNINNQLSNKRHSMKEDSSTTNGNETKLSEQQQQQGNKSPESTPSLSLDKLQFQTPQQEHFRTDSNNSSSSSKRKSLPTNLKLGTPTPKIDSPATEKFWFLLNTPPLNYPNNNPILDDSNIFEKPSSLENDNNLSSQRSSIYDEYISGITMDVISATSPAIDIDQLSNSAKKERRASPSAFQAITNYKNKKNSIINNTNNEKEANSKHRATNSSVSSNTIQPSIPKYLEEEKIDFSQPLITPRYVKDSSIGLSDSVDASISHLKHLISDDFVETGRRNNLAVQSSRELNPSTPLDDSLMIDTRVNNSPNIHYPNSRNIPPLKFKSLSNVNSPTPKNSPLTPAVSVFTTEVNLPNHHHDTSTTTSTTVTVASTRSTRSLPWFISPKSPTQDSENSSSPPPPTTTNNAGKRKSRTSVSDIKGGDIDSLREEIRKYETQTPQNEDDSNNEPPTKYWDEIEEEEQERKRKSLNAIYENFEHLQNIDVVIPRGSAKMASSSGFLNNKRASMTLTSVICGTDLQGSSDYIKNKRSSVNLSNIVFTDKNGEQTVVTPEASGALFGRGDSIVNIDVASDKQRSNRRLSLRQSLSQSLSNKRRSATAFLNSKLFKL